jgi:hypothetical protein
VAFHVEIRRSFRSARAFNLGADELQAKVIAPWLAGIAVEVGGHEWSPADCHLTVLEGPALDPPSLAFGQGWTNAKRSARDVTAELLGPAETAPVAQPESVVALLAPAGAAHERLAALIDALGLRAGAWEPLRARILAAAMVAARPAAPPGTAVVLVDGPPLAADAAAALEHRLDVGLALGALGARAVLVSAAGPAVLLGLGVIDLSAGTSAAHAFAERLRLAGCALNPREGWDASA